MLWI
jgi:hypothetical protein